MFINTFDYTDITTEIWTLKKNQQLTKCFFILFYLNCMFSSQKSLFKLLQFVALSVTKQTTALETVSAVFTQ